MECADGRKTFDGPSYWELFAQFYYRDVSAPEYCRWYSRKKHAFKTPGKDLFKNRNGEVGRLDNDKKHNNTCTTVSNCL